MTETLMIYGAGREAEACLTGLTGAAEAARCLVLDDDPARARALAERFADVAQAIDGLEAAAELIGGGEALLLRAPSVKLDHKAVLWAEARGLAHTTFTGWWLDRHRDRVCATVTGTKGKSTTTVLLAQILTAADAPTRAAGNLGAPPKLDPGRPEERFALELSSYQLADVPAAAPVHVITNLYREHLDWHGGFEPYWRAKRRPLELDRECFGVLRAAQARLMADLPNRYAVVENAVSIAPDRIAAELFGVRADAPLPAGAALDDVRRANLATALTAALATRRAEPAALCAAAAEAAARFRSLPSRQAVVGDFAGRIWVDDALATIPEATLAALARWRDVRVHLVVGGKDRGQDLAALADALRARKDVTVHAYGPTGARLHDALGRLPAEADRDLAAAVAAAYAASDPGDVILFSPAAASFEPGWSYEHRARAFRAAAERLGEGCA